MHIGKNSIVGAGVFLYCSLCASVPAPLAETVSAEVAACFDTAARNHNIPAELLVAIAEVESGLKPLALNRAGTAILPRTLAQAEETVRRMGGERATFDVGIMQVNRWWFEKYGVPYDKGLDPCFNIDFGSRILAMAVKDHGFTWQAVGQYHSPTSWRQDAYARKIFAKLSRLLDKRRSMPLDRALGVKTGEVAMSRDTDSPPPTPFP